MSKPEIIPIPSLPKMRAVVFKDFGSTDQLQYTYVPVPRPGPHDVIVKVKACALNHLDIWTLKGMPGIKITMPHILGCDVAGEVVETGSKAKHIRLNRPVIAAPGQSCGRCEYCRTGWDSLCHHYQITGFQVDGGYAQYVRVPARNIIPVSSKLGPEEWAAVPLVFLTAWHMLVTRAKLQKNESVLIHAAGSGIGSAAIQIAKWIGARVITTVGSDEKIKRAKILGADEVVNYRKKDFVHEVKKFTKGHGADVVFEHIGPDTFAKSVASLCKKGRLVTCGVTSGQVAPLDIRLLFVRQLSITGCYMGGISELKKVVALVEKGKLKPVIDKVFPLREAAEALQRMLARSNFGKIILTP